MGTNYYAHHGPYELHIGKSSAGWCFSLHVYPEKGISTLEDWEKVWSEPGTRIVCEYDREISAEHLREIITQRSAPADALRAFDYAGNYAEPGPYGLVRHRLENGHCIGHGPGTYDYMVGEFS